MPSTPKHILVIRLSSLGDVAMTVPVLRALTIQHPEVKITVLTRSFFAPMFRDLKNVSILTADFNGKHKGLFGLYSLSIELKKLRCDAIADLHNVLRTNILGLLLIGKPLIKINKGRQEKKALVSGKLFKQLKTSHQRYADVFERLGYRLDLRNPTFPERAKLNVKTLEIVGKDAQRWIGIAPFATYESKTYPLDLIKKVIDVLSKQNKILLFGGGNNEVTILNDIEKRFENVINISGKLSFDEELDVISNLDIMLSMDSGNAHLAAMLGIKVVTIWGVTHPFAGFYPFNQPKDYALLADKEKFPLIPTSIYGNKYPEDYRDAARSISPKHVIEKINWVLNT